MTDDYRAHVDSKLAYIRLNFGVGDVGDDEALTKARDVALRGMESHRDVIADALRECVAAGRYGRNQEEVATDRVLKAMGEAGELDDASEDERELVDMYLDTYLSLMRVYMPKGIM